METAQRERAQFYAKLASIPVLENLEEWERLKLESDFQHVMLPLLVEPGEDIRIFAEEVFFALHHVDPARLGDMKLSPRMSEEEARRRVTKQLVPLVYVAARDISRLLDGEAFPMHLSLNAVWMLEKGVFTEQRKKVGVEGKIGWDLYELFRERLFPFRRCPVCRTTFVPVRRQRFCTPTCTYQGIELARKDTRREYMKTYMAQRRKRAKKQKISKK